MPTDEVYRIFYMDYNFISYFIVIFICGSLIRQVTDALRLPLPYTVVLFLIGVVIGFFPESKTIADAVGSHGIMLIFLPLLIFEGAFSVDMYIFKKLFSQIFVLAGPALIASTFISGAVAYYLFQGKGYEDWKFLSSVLFGSILSATDPVAVVGIMKELGTSKRLSLLIEGESLLNDGTAIVLFIVLYDICKGEDKTLLEVGWQTTKLAIGGPLFGWIMAKVSIYWLIQTFNDSLTEISITFSIAYLTFYIGENVLKVSPVLAVVTYGAMLSSHKTAISPEVAHLLHSFWETMGFLGNTLIFALSGIIISQLVLTVASWTDAMHVAILYCMLNLIRGVVLALLAPCLRRIGYGLTWQEGLVCTWSGLRGAVGLALGLIIYTDNDTNPNSILTKNVRYKMLFHVSCIVIGTLVINATTISGLLTFLELSGVNQERRDAMKKAIKLLADRREQILSIFKTEKFNADADWDLINELCSIDDPFNTIENQEAKEYAEIICPHCQSDVKFIPISSDEIRRRTVEATKKYLQLLKQNCSHQFEQGLISGYSLRELTEMLDQAIDNNDLLMIDVQKFQKLRQIPIYVTFLQSFLKQVMVSKCNLNVEHLDNRCGLVYWVLCVLSESSHLKALIYGVDMVQILFKLLQNVLSLDNPPAGVNKTEWNNAWEYGLENLNRMMVVIIVLFFVIRVVMHKMKYIKSIWFVLNGLSWTIAVVEMAYVEVYSDEFFHYSRVVRIFSFLEVIVIVGQHLLRNYTKGCLNFACDVSRAYIKASDQTIKKIGQFSDDSLMCEKITRNAKSLTLKISRELGFLQGLHPDIVLGVKTQQAIRSVLNAMRDGMYELLQDGRIDESQGFKFIKVIESKMKQLQKTPPVIAYPSVISILDSIPWIKKETRLIAFIMKTATEKNYAPGDIITAYGDIPDGLYIIISGLVRAEVPITCSITAEGKSHTNCQNHHQYRTLDYLSSGKIVGEISVLAQSKRAATLVCETPVKALFLSTGDVEEMFQEFSDLYPPVLDRLWRICAMRIAKNVLSRVPHWYCLKKDQMMARLEHEAIVDPMEQGMEELEICSNVADTVLIMGSVYDKNNPEHVFTAPCYIPQEVRSLRLKDKKQTPVFFFVLKMQKRRNTLKKFNHRGIEKIIF